MSSHVTPTPPRRTSEPTRSGPVQTQGEVFSVKQAGHYQLMTIVTEHLPETAKPGQFVAVAPGGELSASLSMAAYSIVRTRASGVYGGTIELVIDQRGPASQWLARHRPRDVIDLIGPLGRPFSLPTEAVTCALVGVDYAAAPLFSLAERLRELGCGVHIVLGADTEQRLYGVLDARRAAVSVTVATADGSVGTRGRVTDVLGSVIERGDVDVLYAAAPAASMSDLRGVAGIASERRLWCQTLVESAMPCATGLCQACTVPVLGENWHPRVVRGCYEGPVFPAERVRWDALVDAAAAAEWGVTR